MKLLSAALRSSFSQLASRGFDNCVSYIFIWSAGKSRPPRGSRVCEPLRSIISLIQFPWAARSLSSANTRRPSPWGSPARLPAGRPPAKIITCGHRQSDYSLQSDRIRSSGARAANLHRPFVNGNGGRQGQSFVWSASAINAITPAGRNSHGAYSYNCLPDGYKCALHYGSLQFNSQRFQILIL